MDMSKTPAPAEKEKSPMQTQEDPNQLVAHFQSYQQQMQSLMIQKESLKLQAAEVDKALEELGKTQQKSAYKISGQVMVSKPVEELKSELMDVKENIQLRITSVQKSEERVNGKLKELQEKIKDLMMKG